MQKHLNELNVINKQLNLDDIKLAYEFRTLILLSSLPEGWVPTFLDYIEIYFRWGSLM